MSKAALMYCCQSRPGAGRIQRALALADKLSEQFAVTMLISDPAPETMTAPENVKLVFLQALVADPDSSVTSLAVTGERQQRIRGRCDAMLRLYDELRPRVVAIDGFPFKQYRLRREFLPLIERARDGRYGESLVACVTDGILANDKPNNDVRADRAADILDKYFDIAIVRSDPVFARVEEFFQPGNTVHIPLYHTGFVVRQQREHQSETRRKKDGIVVSAGNGRRGMALYKSAIEAHRLLQQTLPMPMKIVAGGHLPENDWQALRLQANGLPALSLRRGSTSVSAEMAAARWSVSDCGYNTAVDAMRTRTPSLFVPHAAANRREQIERAKRLVYWGAGRLLMARHLNTASLVNEIHQLTKFEPRSMNFDLNGANNAAQVIAQIVYQNNYTPVSTRPSSDTRLQ